tara:strand:- start:505 stop:633 length:129 start_codon:yes stop_codon:yes gene_type:complete
LERALGRIDISFHFLYHSPIKDEGSRESERTRDLTEEDRRSY